MTVATSTAWRARPRVIHTKIPRGVVLLDPETKNYFELNRTGGAIWKALLAGGTAESLAVHLADAFEVNLEVARTDVEALLRELSELDLIERASPEEGLPEHEDHAG